ncbi:hypothetical protein F4820DRAFT_446528 [Hypoxylon rubiginosum]|uniref:Uncharacterized protein n=1 Tax=Hypoxylon rubiginosum TaxID=110542 RepID=A0ACB9Z7N0_9PEZI|nr:hypothetical protein F4820DRAFT_446528 [Hypoxylon rubiginosum]
MSPFNFNPSGAIAWVRENPGKALLYGAAGAGTSVALAPALVASPALAFLGFGADGIVKASVAAGIQSGIGNVVAPSLFATLQSAGMAGYGAAVVNGAVSAGGGALALASAGAAAMMANAEPSSHSHGLNPIEYVWSRLKSDISLDGLPDVHETSTRIMKMMRLYWALIPVDVTNDPVIIDAMRRRMMRIIQGEEQTIKNIYLS